MMGRLATGRPVTGRPTVRGAPRGRQRQRGVAVVVAILIVALAASTSTYLLWHQSLATRHVENLTMRAQADAIARAGAALAASILNTDNRNVDHLQEFWAQPLPPFQAETAMLSGALADEQAKFNLNGIVAPTGIGPDAVQLAVYARLLATLQLPTDLAQTLLDWIDVDQEASAPGGAEDVYYLTLEPAYRTPGARLAHVSELRRIKGYTEAIIATLAPHVTALPTATRINVNTASAEVIEAAVLGMTRGIAQQIVETRKTTPFLNVADLGKTLPEDLLKNAQAVMDVKTSYFSAEGTVLLGRITVTYRALIDRSDGRWPRIIASHGESL